MAIKFEWDERKARNNRRKHGIDFNEASTVFSDILSITILDSEHSVAEERWITLGLSVRERLLVVIHTDKGDTVRIISARPANRLERKQYEET